MNRYVTANLTAMTVLGAVAGIGWLFVKFPISSAVAVCAAVYAAFVMVLASDLK
jgi:hypothetical protein